MCNTKPCNNCCHEEDLLCCMPIKHCCGGYSEHNNCCPHDRCCCSSCCGGCGKCCDCDCCYCKYYKLLNKLKDQLAEDEQKITELQGNDNRIENKVENYKTFLLNKIIQLEDNLSDEISNRIDDVTDEQNRAKAAEADLLQQLLKEIRDRSQGDIDLHNYIVDQINYVIGNVDPRAIDSIAEILDYLNNDEDGKLTQIFNRLVTDEGAITAINNTLTTVLNTINTNTFVPNPVPTLTPGDTNKLIATVNGKEVKVNVAALPTNANLNISQGTNTYHYNGSTQIDIAVPTKAETVSGISFNEGNGVMTITYADNHTSTINLLWYVDNGKTRTTSGRAATANKFYDLDV